MSNRSSDFSTATARAAATALVVIAGAWLQAAPAAADEPRLEPKMYCGHDVCLVVQDASDRDGDGVSDQDELAAGTDPDDPSIRPHSLQLIDLFAKGALPSFQMGLATIVVLPTLAPDGTGILGGLPALPSRKSAFERLGLTGDLLGGLDLSNGLTIGPGGGGSGKSDAPPWVVGGVSIGLVADGEPTALMNDALGKSMNRRWAIGSVTKGPESSLGDGGTLGYSRVVRDNGSVDEVSWQTIGNKASVSVTSYDEKGHPSGSTSETTTSRTDPDGTKTDTKTTNSDDGKGVTTSTTTTTTTIPSTNDRPTVTVTETTSAKTTTNKDGSTTTTTTSSTQVVEGGILKDSSSSSVTKTCQGDECTTTKTDDGGSSSTCDASKDSCSPSGEADAYVVGDDSTYDASRDLRRMGLVDVTTVNTTLAVLGGNIDYTDPPIDPAEGGLSPSSSPEGPLVILVAPDYVSCGLTIVNGDPRLAKSPQPEYDPNLPNPLVDGGDGGDSLGGSGCTDCGAQ